MMEGKPECAAFLPLVPILLGWVLSRTEPESSTYTAGSKV